MSGQYKITISRIEPPGPDGYQKMPVVFDQTLDTENKAFVPEVVTAIQASATKGGQP